MDWFVPDWLVIDSYSSWLKGNWVVELLIDGIILKLRWVVKFINSGYSIYIYISDIAFVSRHVCLNQKFIEVITYAKRNELIHIVFTTEGLFELVIESWSDVLTGRAIRLWVHLALRASFVQLLQFQHLFSVDFVSAIAFVSRHVCFNRNFIEVMTWV